MNVPLLSDITEQIALLLFITVNADQKRRTTPFSQDFLCHLRLWTDLVCTFRSLTVALFGLLVGEPGYPDFIHEHNQTRSSKGEGKFKPNTQITAYTPQPTPQTSLTMSRKSEPYTILAVIQHPNPTIYRSPLHTSRTSLQLLGLVQTVIAKACKH
jgi:hypothetical protein